MSKRRNFSAEFKARVALDALSGESDTPGKAGGLKSVNRSKRFEYVSPPRGRSITTATGLPVDPFLLMLDVLTD